MSLEHRRSSDNCIIKNLWEKFTPYVQLAGWLPVIGGICVTIWLVVGFIKDTLAYAPAIVAIQQKQDSQEQMLFSMQQEVHDIHEWLQNSRRK